MNKRICSLLLAIVMVIGLLPMSVFAAEENTVTEIATVTDLQTFAAAVNAGDNYAGKTVKLIADIEVNDYWYDNVSNVDHRIIKDFAGTFDGNGYAIKGLKVQNTNISANPQMYLFSSISGTVKNLTLDGVDADINDRDCFGFIAYKLTGTANNCHVKNVTVDVAVNASGTGYMYSSGAMFGQITSATVTGCSASNITFTPTGTDNSDNVGALIGIASGSADAHTTITSCSVTGFTLDATRKTKRTGGFVGYANYTDVSDCTATNITFTIDTYYQTVGGFVGYAGDSAKFTNCSVTGFDVDGGSDDGDSNRGSVGGFCAFASGASFNECTVSQLDIDVSYDYTGTNGVAGFLGYANGTVTATDCTVAGDIDVTGTGVDNCRIGNIVGTSNNQTVTATNCTTNIKSETIENLTDNGLVAVAQIGNTPYTTLAKAVDKARAGDTITLLSDIEITEPTTFTMAEGVTLDLNGNTIKGDDGKAIFTGTNITIKNGTVTGYNGSTLDYYPITINSGSATLEGLTFTNGGVKIKGGATVTLKDNAITANQNKFKYAVWAFEKSKVTIESGTYIGGKNGYDVLTEGGAKITVYGGTYKYARIEDNIAANQELILIENEDGTYSVIKNIGVASVNGRKYTTLQEAINAANAGDTVTLLESIEATEQIVINKNLTLDLGEFTINGTIAGDGVLRIYGNESIEVTINATTGGITNTAEGYAINSGNITDVNAKTTLTINGGNYAATQCIYQNNGLCTINGGSFKATDTQLTLNNKDGGYLGDFMVNGGKFYLFNPACMSINKGEHHDHDNIAEGKTATRDADGWYTVVDGTTTFVAQVSSKYESLDRCYTNLADAIAEAKDATVASEGAVIKLIDDCTIDVDGTTVTLPDYATLDLNGYTLTIPYQKTLFAGGNITIKNGTITTGEKKNYVLYLMSGSFTIENVTTAGGINIQGGNVTLKDVEVSNITSRYYAVYAGNGAYVTIESGIFKNPHSTATTTVYGNGIIYGGTFSKNPSALVAEGRYVYDDGSNYYVCKLVMTYDELVDAVESNSVIKLGADITAPEAVVINKSLTLDLGEYTITGNIAGDGVVRIVADEVINVTINATTGGITNTAEGYAINSGNITDVNAKTTLTINGGNYAATQCIYQNNGLCTINDGSFKATDTQLTLNNKDGGYLGDFMVNGGKFYLFNPACMSINKGEHHDHNNIAEGKTATRDAEGWYTVVDGTTTFVAQVSSKYESLDRCYTNLADAIAEAKDATVASEGAVIKLIADCTIDVDGATITLPDYATLDLNGYTLTIPFQETIFKGENITIKNGTITTGAKENYGLYIQGGSFTLENITTTNGINIQNAEVTLENATVKCPNKYYPVYAGSNSKVTVLSGTFTAVRNDNVLYADNTSTITAFGGTYNKKPTAKYIANGYVAVKDGSNYIVREGSLQEIIDAAEAGTTVTLIKNYELTETVIINKDLTLDLGAYTINSTANVAVYANGGNLTINGTTGGIYTTGTVAVGQDNGTCTINGGSFKAAGNTHDVANGQPVNYRYTLDNSEGGNGAFDINGGSFYGFTPACMFINYNDRHDHDSIFEGKVAVLDENGWFTVAEGTLTHTIVCECDYPAPSHQYCFTSYEQAELFIELFTNCEHDKIVEIAE